MDLLPRSDTVHLKAAEGWLDLGNHQEAAADLERITPAQSGHPDVLHLRWRVHATAKQWDASLKILIVGRFVGGGAVIAGVNGASRTFDSRWPIHMP